jgi:flavin-binding protein dodecin
MAQHDPPGAICKLRSPVRFLVGILSLWSLIPEKRLIQNVGKTGSEPVLPGGYQMEDHVYKVLELVGSSEKSIEDAIQNAITRASKTLREMKWFEVLQTRGHIENGSVRHYQVTLKVGFTLEK